MPEDTSGLTTRPSLLVRLREPGDRDAWNTFVEVYGPLVLGHCRRRGLAVQDAEDVTQEVFARLSEAIRTFVYQPELGRFRTWLGTVVRNEVARFFKRKGREVPALGGSGALEPEDTQWSAEFNTHLLQAALRRCRPHFEEATWRAFELVWLHNHPAPAVAAEMGREIDWVYVAKSRVLKRLWSEVQELADDTILAACSPSS